MGNLLQDLRFALRMLAKRPGFVALAVGTLALGIGANTTLFSVVKSVLLEPLPYPAPEQLVRIYGTNPEKNRYEEGSSKGNVADWQERSSHLQAIGAWYVVGRTLRTDQAVQVVSTAQVSKGFFQVAAKPPLLGRTFTDEETDRAMFNTAAAPVGTDPVVILSHHVWQQLFGADPEIVGKSLTLERQSWQIVGVMPAGFDLPESDADLWIPWSFEGRRLRDQHFLGVLARLGPGATLAQAQAELSGVAADLAEEYPESNRGWGVRLVPLQEELVRRSRPALLILLGAVGFVLLIACVNVANFQLARATERRREVAVRAVLGASRLRLVRQFLVENLVLASVGGGLGLLLSVWGVQILKALRPGNIPRLEEVSVDAGVLAFSLALTLLTGILFGMAPALEGTRTDLAGGLKQDGSRSATPGRGRRRLRGLLVISELAIAVLLLSGAGLLMRSFVNLRAADPGFQADKVLVLPIFLNNRTYDSGTKCRGYYAELTGRLAALPGVEAVGGATALPMSKLGPDFHRPVWAEGEMPAAGASMRADIRMATPDYFKTVGMSVVRGRPFNAQDGPEAARVVIINESLARRTWPGLDPVGRRLVVDYSSSGTYPYEVVGVVNDIRFYGLRTAPRPELYLPHAQRSYLIMNMAVRTAADPAALVPLVRQALRDVDPDQPAHSIVPLGELVGDSVERDRFAMGLLGAFAGVALLLAVMGVYGLLSYLVRQRTTEFGIRLALGAQRGDIFRLVVRHGGGMALVGLGVGLAASMILTRLLAGMLFGVSPLDPVTLGGVLALLSLAVLAACVLPARRATRVDVNTALRYE
jgi:putative ABC transport system permease protein